MRKAIILKGFLRHSGYAMTSFALLSLFVEKLLPTFTTAHTNPYLLVLLGFILMIIGEELFIQP